MGIIDFVKGGIRELAIARPDAAKGLVVYKHPDKTIPMKAQLTVEPDEVALFFRDGLYKGQLGPGRHTMETSNIPFLDQLVDWGTGGNLWIAEIYFVTTREMPNHKFGGKIGKILDPQSGIPVELMVNGTYSIRVIDPPKLLIGLVGLGNDTEEEFLDWFKQIVLRHVKDDIAELMVKKKWPMLDVTSGAFSTEISTQVIATMRSEIEGYGLEVVRMANFNLAMKEEDEQRLNKIYENAAYMKMTGSVQNYQAMASANAMMSAGDAMKMPGGGGGGGNALAQGAGLGIGLAMAQQMNSGRQGDGSAMPGLGGGGGGVSSTQTAPPQTATIESLSAQIDGLTERLAKGEITETLYTKLVGNLEQRIEAIKNQK
jgi:membrane protease subunit (stomatin/prohibitin family)